MKDLKNSMLVLLILTWGIWDNGVQAQTLPHGFPSTDRSKSTINQDWKFHLGDPEGGFYGASYDDSSWETVTLPHTLSLTSLALDGMQDEKTQLEFHREVGWYRRQVTVPENDKKVYLEFEGAHQVTDLWVNGKHVGKHEVGGYTPFHFDITDHVEKGTSNQITLLVDNRRNEAVPPDPGPFDYVKFSGLYRDVYLVQTHPVHVGFNWESMTSGVTITTPTVDPVNRNATINVKTSVKNDLPEPVEAKVLTRIIDQEGMVVMRLAQTAKIPAGQSYQYNQIGSLEDNVQLWGIDNPYLYRVNSVVVVNDQTVDYVENNLGIRKFELDPQQGFILNGKPIELIGFNRHQQYPYVGDAVPNSLHYKDMLQFKEFGFNVMRTAHYPQDDAILDACDRLGILVYEEAPSWIDMSKNPQWWENFEKAERTMIRNHRNHPSVVIWGGGINHRGYVPRVHNTAKQEDPTRLTASQGARWTGWQSSGLTDINANMLYGPFIWDRSEPMFAMEGHAGPKALAPFRADTLMTGLISWTAHAYYTFHPSHDKANDPIDRTRSGAMTIFRYPRPDLHWYKAEMKEEPFIYIPQDWTAGRDSITVFSNVPEVVLYVNDKEIARKKPSQDTAFIGLHHAPFVFNDVTYEEGTLKAVAANSGGEPVFFVRRTPKKPRRIVLEVDTVGRDFTADGSDILMTYAKVVDENGTVVRDYDDKVQFSVEGDASVIGDSKDINANPMFTEYGVAPALIRAGKVPGTVTIKASAKGLESGMASVQLVPNEPDRMISQAKPIYDFTSTNVDIGANDQLVQFGWEYWLGKEEEASNYEIPGFEEATVRVTTTSGEGIIRWLGEMNVIGKYGFVYGDGLLGIDDKGIQLTFSGLPAGTYRLKTWHHAPQSNSDEMDPNKEKLKHIRILDIPHERSLTIKSDQSEEVVKVTEGKNMQEAQPGIATVYIKVEEGRETVVYINGHEGKGIWLNGFQLSEWFSEY
ncbi:glycoside hydrolase family 2 protein [Echinicola strongylocentroti]|nr:glycoside hydrolase family 2 TIM barrel-domain containing protein [Echinicola strongylocentroti]